MKKNYLKLLFILFEFFIIINYMNKSSASNDKIIVICGDIKSGKSSIVTRFTKKAFDENYKPTMGKNYFKE